MKLAGCSAISAEVVLTEARELAFAGRAFLIWCDGADLTALLADEGDRAKDLRAFAPRVLPELVDL